MIRVRRLVFVGAVACGCSPSTSDAGGDTDRSDASDSTDPSDTDTSDTSDTGTALTVDCAALPTAPLTVTQLGAARGYHDLVFDDDGHVLGSDGNSLLRVTYDDQVSVYLPGVGAIQGMDRLPGGDIVYADEVGSLIRATPSGATTVLAPGSGAYTVYGVTVGPDGWVYLANWTTIERYDPDTGAHVTVLDDPRISPYVLDFSPDHRRMYVGTIWHNGYVWAVDLDADLLPDGEPTLLATVGGGPKQLHDALGVDACGNLYVAEFYTDALYRITPAGDVALFYDYTTTDYGHGLAWGSGIGGWRADALYVPQPYDGNRVSELVIGVPSRP